MEGGESREKKRTVHDQSICQTGWSCYGLGMAATGTASLVFIEKWFTADGSSRMNAKVYRNIIIADWMTLRLAAEKVFKTFVQKVVCPGWSSQSPDLNPIEHTFHLLKTRLKQELKRAVQAWYRPGRASLGKIPSIR